MAAPGYTSPPQFTLFPCLPIEIRLIVWEQVCTEERIIPLLPGLAHLFPITHPTLAVPPVLHACSQSRRIALSHYNLSFHPQVYTNPDHDRLMLHVFFPLELIDFSLYHPPMTNFNWDEAPRRLAVFLDDISFHQSDDDLFNDVWQTEPGPWRKRLQPFTASFARSLRSHFTTWRPEEITLLILPPLTARPNPTMHRINLVEGTPALSDLGDFLMRQLRDRTHDIPHPGYDDNEADSTWISPPVRVRHATCSPWPLTPDMDPAAMRERHPAAYYADLEFGNKPVLSGPELQMRFGRPPSPFYTGSRKDRIRGIRKDLKLLRAPFSLNTGLGSNVLWEEERYGCGTSIMIRGVIYKGTRQPIWWDGDQEELAKWIDPGSPDFDFGRFNFEFDFDAFLKDFESGKVSDPWDMNEDGETEVEDEDPLTIKTLRLNGLVYYD
ncbi:hypothetical protein B0H67DRAFT_147624 [Lasiosphaeris hirsuta]|uniref:2EXR domain-containing protein n=1 Tax=Lasiosphaeris hirsuta TaxID=260670 RepID=A0AA40ANI0_9PEZI|nr:hypothetical protein B0H67DRAFT_147624 [Lasiosphaeris hirsuta]